MSSNIDTTTPKTGSRIYALDIRIFKQTVKDEIEALQNTVSSSLTPATNTDQLPEGGSNLYFTTARAISALTSTLSSYVTSTSLATTLSSYVASTSFTASTIKTLLGISTLSGSNTGDQTITLQGDVTGSGTGNFIATLANTGVSPTSYTFANFTVDSKGRITAASNGATANTTTTGLLTNTDWNTFNSKQTELTSGVNIKTVNGNSLLGSGDLTISAGGGDGNNTATVTVASATDCLIFAQASENIKISGTATIESFGTSGLTVGQKKFVRATGTFYLTDTANLQTEQSRFGGLEVKTGECFVVYVESTTSCRVAMVSTNDYRRYDTDVALGLNNVGNDALFGFSVQVGHSTKAGMGSVSIGHSAGYLIQDFAVAVGKSAMSFTNATALGSYTFAEGIKSTALGSYAYATRCGEVAICPDSDRKLNAGFITWSSNGVTSEQPLIDGASYFNLKANTVVMFDIHVCAIKAGVIGAAWIIQGAARKGTGFNSETLIGVPVVTIIANDDPAVFINPTASAVLANTTFSRLMLNIPTGVGIRIHAHARITEVTL